MRPKQRAEILGGADPVGALGWIEPLTKMQRVQLRLNLGVREKRAHHVLAHDQHIRQQAAVGDDRVARGRQVGNGVASRIPFRGWRRWRDRPVNQRLSSCRHPARS